jgi:conjugative transfer pilus assembly protein TraH
VGKIQARQALSVDEQDFLNMVTLPVYKMASVYSAQQGASAAGTMEQYSDIIALDLLYTWINRSVSSVEDGARNMVGVDQDQLDQWRVSITGTRQELAAKQSQVQQKVGAIEQMIARTQSVESVLAARMGTRIGDTIAFAASQTPN